MNEWKPRIVRLPEFRGRVGLSCSGLQEESLRKQTPQQAEHPAKVDDGWGLVVGDRRDPQRLGVDRSSSGALPTGCPAY